MGAAELGAHEVAAHPERCNERWPHAGVLVVDDEPDLRQFLSIVLAPTVGQVWVAADAEQAETLLRRHRVDLLVLDIALPGKNGMQLLRELRTAGSRAGVVLITGFADTETAIEALRAGADDMLVKPFRVEQLHRAARRALKRARRDGEDAMRERGTAQRTPRAARLVGRSIIVKGLQAALQQTAAVDSTVLLSGESGTGKELAALTLHGLSSRADAAFVPVNCATATPAQLEAELFGHGGSAAGSDALLVRAEGGTLFLDEVGELAPALQAALLRVLEERRLRSRALDLRVVAATNRVLADDLRSGRFRTDLYWRLRVVEIRLPALRAHKEDIPDLVAHFIGSLAPRLGVPPIEISDAEMDCLQQHDWPGNVRELRNLIERSLIAGALDVSALYRELPIAPSAAPSVPAAPLDLQTLRKQHIRAVLESVGGDKTQAAALLGVSLRTLQRHRAE